MFVASRSGHERFGGPGQSIELTDCALFPFPRTTQLLTEDLANAFLLSLVKWFDAPQHGLGGLLWGLVSVDPRRGRYAELLLNAHRDVEGRRLHAFDQLESVAAAQAEPSDKFAGLK